MASRSGNAIARVRAWYQDPDTRARLAFVRDVISKKLSAKLHLPQLNNWMLLTLSVVLTIWALAAGLTASSIAAGTTVSGVDVSGLSQEQAAEKLQTELADELSQPLTLTAGGGEVSVDPASVELAVDTDASLEGLTGFTLWPQKIISRLHGSEHAAVTTLNTELLTQTLEDALPEMSQGAQSATVTLDGTEITVTGATAGEGLDIPTAVDQLAEQWPLGAETLPLPEGEAEPAITDAEAASFVDGTLTPLLAEQTTVTYGEGSFTLSAAEIAELATITTEGGELGVELDAAQLRKQSLAAFGEDIETAGTNASWTIAGSADATPELVAATPGTKVDGAALSSAIVAAATEGTYSAEVSFKDADAKITDEDAQSWGVNEVVGEFSTEFESDTARDQNLTQGCEQINGTLVMPGETFSMTDALGTIDEEHGFTESGVLSGNDHALAMGGGLSQVTTSIFNAAFETGLDDVEHTPHSIYLSRYPEGREATIWTGQIDMKFKNSTPSAVLVQAWVADDQVHVRLWSTPYYEVKINTSDRRNEVDYTTTTSSSNNCVENLEGQPAFDVTITRQRSIIETGEELNKETLNVHYAANNVVKCS